MRLGIMLAAAALIMAGSCSAAVVTIDTSAISGQTGFLDFQFNAGPFTLANGTATITGFTTDGVLDPAPALPADVSGSLIPGPLVIDNGGFINEYLQSLTFGNTLSFFLSLDATSNTAADLNSAGTFTLQLLQADGLNSFLTSDPSGNSSVVTQDLLNDGSTNGSAQTFGLVPEPSTFALAGVALALLTGLRTRRSRQRS